RSSNRSRSSSRGNSFSSEERLTAYIARNDEVQLSRSYAFSQTGVKKEKTNGMVGVNYKKLKDGILPSEQLYIVVKDKRRVKEIKMFLEDINNFDNSRKIYFSGQGNAHNLSVEGFFIPIKKKFELLRNYEYVKEKLLADKTCVCTEGGFLYMQLNIKREKRKVSLKDKLKEMFENFVDDRIKGYINSSERELILRAHTKYEVIGSILIFHYENLKPVVRLYEAYKKMKMKMRMMNATVMQMNKKCEKKSKRVPRRRDKMKFNHLTLQMKWYEYKYVVKEVDKFWVGIKNIFNDCNGERVQRNEKKKKKKKKK
ncbi:hypothetical protein PMLGA01_060005200, partial [Plasmodium malariae]